MLTTRGFWFFIINFAVLAVALLLGAVQLTLVCLTLLFWFLARWFLFQLRIRLALGRLSGQRSLRTSRGDVEAGCAGQKVQVGVTLSGGCMVACPYFVMSDRLAPLA